MGYHRWKAHFCPNRPNFDPKAYRNWQVPAISLVFGWATQHHEKERRRNIEYKMASLDMSPQEAMDCYTATMQQPAWYDDNFVEDPKPKKERSSQKKAGSR
jgi:hypothetical protein